MLSRLSTARPSEQHFTQCAHIPASSVELSCCTFFLQQTWSTDIVISTVTHLWMRQGCSMRSSIQMEHLCFSRAASARPSNWHRVTGKTEEEWAMLSMHIRSDAPSPVLRTETTLHSLSSAAAHCQSDSEVHLGSCTQCPQTLALTDLCKHQAAAGEAHCKAYIQTQGLAAPST